jgi:hypothetical protein
MLGLRHSCVLALRVLLDPETWKRYSAGLASFTQHGIKHERTTDLASLLRSPGTHNRKQGTARTVQAEALTGPHELQQFARLLDELAPHRSQPVNGHSVAGRLSQIAGSTPRSSRNVVAGCKQLKNPSINAAGHVPQPLWYAGLGVFAFIEEDGDEAAHQWSSDDDRYTFEETQRKLDQARALRRDHLQSLPPN